jgi:hypothetical protein
MALCDGDGLALRDGDGDDDEIHSRRRRDSLPTAMMLSDDDAHNDRFTPDGSFQNRKYLRSDTIHVSLVYIVVIPAIHRACDT